MSMEYTKVVEKLITTNFKSKEEFYQERDKQLDKVESKMQTLEEKIKKLQEQKEELERIKEQLIIF